MDEGNLPGRCDVAVIGGGPGGSTAAALLARKGYDVVLIEKEKHPRFVVGESIIPHFWKYAEYVGADKAIAADGFVEKAGGTVVWNGAIRQMRFRDFGYNRPALHVERDRFDKILLDNAGAKGAQIFEETAVTRVELREDGDSTLFYRPKGESGSRQIKARFVVDASGQGAVIARQLGLRVVDDGFRFMSIWGYYRNSKYVAADGRAYPFEMLRSVPPTTFVSNVEDWGWLWHIPMRESTSIGFVLPQTDMRQNRGIEELAAYYRRLCHETPNLGRLLTDAEYLEGSFHVIRDYSYLPKQLAGPGYFLVGDAAAFVDPIFSIGVVLAMYSAFLAAWAIDRSMQKADRTATARAVYASQFGTRLEASRSLALPRYGVGEDAVDRLAYSLQFETSLEQELMYVVSTLTTRSENFTQMSRNLDQPVTSSKYRLLEEIAF